MKLATILAFTAGLSAAACSLPAADKASDGAARAFYQEVRTGADLSRDAHVDPSLETPASAAALAQLRAALPPGAPTSVSNAGWSYNSSTGRGSVAQLSHRYAYPGRTITIQTVMRKPPGGTVWFITGLEADLGGAQPPIVVGAAPRPDTDSE